MSFQVRVTFTGLCTPLHAAAGDLSVILVDATPASEKQAAEEQAAAGMHQHTPFMAVRRDQISLNQGQRHLDDETPDLQGETLAIFHLDREELTFETSSPLEFVTFARPGEMPRTEDEEGTMAWLASLERLGHGLRTLHPACFGDLRQGPVAVRVNLPGGKVQCRRVIKIQNELPLWEFRASSDGPVVGGARQALGDLVSVDLTVPDPQETVAGGQILSSTKQPVVLLPPLDGKPVEIAIGNLPFGLHQHEAPTEATHFRWFYELLQNPPALFERPIPFKAAVGPLTSQSRACPQLTGGIFTGIGD